MFEPVRTADINGDGLSDLKLIVSYNGSGLACLNVRVIYLFQKNGGEFAKLSFDDMKYKTDDKKEILMGTIILK